MSQINERASTQIDTQTFSSTTSMRRSRIRRLISLARSHPEVAAPSLSISLFAAAMALHTFSPSLMRDGLDTAGTTVHQALMSMRQTQDFNPRTGNLSVEFRCGFDDRINSPDPKPYPHPIIEVTLPADVYGGSISVIDGATETVASAPLEEVTRNQRIVMSEYAKGYSEEGKRNLKLDIRFHPGKTYNVRVTDKKGDNYAGSVQISKDCK